MKARSMRTIAAICILFFHFVPACIGAAKPAAKPKPALKINSVTFSAPVPLKPGDIITVDLAGTPGGKAAFSVKNFIPIVKMQELSPGSYHATVKVPKGRTARNAPLVGYLGYKDAQAAPVQAGRLVTLVDAEPTRLPAVKPENAAQKPVPPAAPKPVEIAAPVAPPAPAKPKPEAVSPKIVLTSPVDGEIARRAIVVMGTADPGSAVRVSVTYSNGLAGLLKLSGEVASQNMSAGRNGEFKMGPIALDGPLATDGLRFTIKAYYPDRADHATAEVSVTGKRDWKS